MLVTDEYVKLKAYYGLKECIVFVGDAASFDHMRFRFMRKQSVCDLTTRNIIVEPRMKYKCDDCALRFRDHYRLILHRDEAHAADAKSNSSDEEVEPDDDYEPPNDEDEDEEEDDDDFVPIEPKVEITTDADKAVKFNSIVEQTLFDPTAAHSGAQTFALSDSLFANIGATPKTAPAPSGSQQQRVYTCSKCTFVSYTKADHNAHMKAAHKFFTCDVCPQSFFSKNNLDFHTKLKHPAEARRSTGALICENCDLQVATVAELVTHKQAAHQVQKELLCEQCGLTALSASDLDMHCKHAHAKEGKYKCLECRVTFKEFAHLNGHIKLHQHGCSLCGFYFPTVKALIAHKLAEHKTSPERFCPICGYTCPKGHRIRKHMEGHGCEVFACQFCGWHFATQEDLGRHEQTKHKYVSKVLAKTRYKCGQCNRIYTAKGALEHHLKTDHKVADKSKLTATIQQSSSGANPTILNHTQQLPRINDAVVVGNSVIVPSSDEVIAGSSTGDTGSVIKYTQAALGAGKDPTILVVDKNNQAFLVPAIMVNQNGQMKLAFKGNALPEGVQIAPDQKLESLLGGHPPLTNAGKPQTATILNSTVALPRQMLPLADAKVDDIKFMPALVQRRYDKKNEPAAPKSGASTEPAPDIIASNLVEPRDTELEYFEDEEIDRQPFKVPPLLLAYDSPSFTPNACEANQGSKEEDSQPPALEEESTSAEHRPKIFLKPLSQLLEKPAANEKTASKPGPSKQPHLTKITADKVPEYIRKVNSPGNAIKASKPAAKTSIEEVINKVAAGAGGITSKRTYSCKGCNIVFKRFYRFQQHQRKFRCKLCDYTGCKVKELDLHYRSKHNFKNQCITCDIKFPSSVELQAHNKVVHYCTKCSKFYTSITKHSTMFKCIKCGDFECSVGKLSEHYSEKHGIMHMCTPCNEIYKSPEEFATHKKDVHYCTNCNSFKMNLSLHMRFCKGGAELQDAEQAEVIGIDDSD